MTQYTLEQKWDKDHEARTSTDKLQSGYSESVEREIKPKSSICDLGGGRGSDALYFLSKGHPVVLCDISGYALKVASDKAHQVGLSLDIKKFDLDKEKIPLEDKSVDVVYSRLGLHYFSYSRTIEIFSDIFRILKDSGKAFIVVKSLSDKDEMAFIESTAEKIENGTFSEDGITKSRFTNEQWGNILKDSGIEKFEVREYREAIKGKNDLTKSGADELLLTEIIFEKNDD